MRQATSQEPVSDSGHSLILDSSESNGTSRSLKSAAMLGIALSVGASGTLISPAEASAARIAPTTPATTEAFSSESTASTEAATAQPVASLHTVESGESLWQIAQQHRVGLRDLKSANALAPETSIKIGQVLKVPSADATVASSDAVLISSRATADTQTASAKAESATEDNQQASAAPEAGSENAALEMTATPAPALGIEIADASVQTQPSSAQSSASNEAPAPVVTAYAPTPATSRYQVQAGDTLRSIASSYGTTADELVRANALIDPNVIFVGTTLVVPAEQPAAQATVAAKASQPVPTTQAAQSSSRPDREQATLRNTTGRSTGPRILDEMRSASPEEPISVGGEQVTEQDLIGESNSVEADPYVANLLEDVEEIRTQPVEVSEADAVGNESAIAEPADLEADAVPATSRLLARVNSSDRISRLNVAGSEPAPVAVSTSEVPATTAADSDLLAAAPISPDAYIPAQRSSAGQVVSPDMPILPAADEYLPEAPNYFDGYMWPTEGTVTSGYGWRWGRMHRGVDVAGPVGTPVVAAAAGVVEQAGWNSGGYGNLVEIRHPDGSLTRYAHNNSLNVSAGQNVRQGQQIAEMGSTGYSTGPHLHFEVHQGGSAVNPVAYLPSR